MKNMTHTITRAGAALVLGLVLGAGTAGAASSHKVEVSNGTLTFTIEDDGVGDAAAATPGLISFFVNFGGGAYTTGTASTSVASAGNKDEPLLTLGSLVIDGENTYTIKHTDTGYATLGNAEMALAVNSLTTPGGSVSYSAYFDETNTEFGTGNLINTITLTAVDAETANGGGPNSALYSLTEIVTVMLTSPGQSQFVTELAIKAVPEPATLMLFGMSLAGAGAFYRRRLRRQAITA